jgi:D-alanine--poly(phosphoribitol) ligase subunit 2
MKTSPRDWLIPWFERRSSLKGTSLEDKLLTDYFEAALIDSFGVIELITAIEGEFHIKFTENHFQDRRFSTISGLEAIIIELTNSARGIS